MSQNENDSVYLENTYSRTDRQQQEGDLSDKFVDMEMSVAFLETNVEVSQQNKNRATF
jgi:hypothetical protein